MESSTLIAALVALALGALIGWLVAGRQAGGLRAERDSFAERFKSAISDLATESEKRASADTQLAGLISQQTERDRAHDAQIKQLQEAQAALTAQFRDVGQQMLATAQQQFLDRADARFKESEATAGQNLKALLSPVHDTLKRYDEKLGLMETARVGSYAELNKAISDLAVNNDVTRRETARLANVMTASPKARGRWGEEHLKNILESAGLAENIDFVMQASVNDGESQLRPDFIINLPGDRCIVIDVKFPLVHYEAAFDEEDNVKRGKLLDMHAAAMRSYAADLGRKKYWAQFETSPDFVVMFIPGEHRLSAAAERDHKLIDDAFSNNVIVASTINMLALAKLMAGMWRQEKLAGQAREIAELGKEFYGRLVTLTTHIARVGKNLGQATGAYNEFISSLDRQLITSAQKLEALNVDTGGRRLETPPTIEVGVQVSKKLPSPQIAPAAIDDAEG